MRDWKKIVASAFALFALADLPAHASAIGEIEMRPSSKATYAAQSADFAPAASTTDFACMVGSGTKTIKILQIKLTLLNGASQANNTIDVIRRSTDNTGGTSTSPTVAKFDSSSASSTATIRHYTANPSGLGTSAGVLATKQVTSIYGSTYMNTPFPPGLESTIFDATTGLQQPIVLRGTSEVLALNGKGVSLSAATAARVTWVWTEE